MSLYTEISCHARCIRTAPANCLAAQVRVGEGQDGFLRWACAISTSLGRARIRNTTSAVCSIRSAWLPIHARPRDLAGRERESRENADPGGGVHVVDLGARFTDELAALRARHASEPQA